MARRAAAASARATLGDYVVTWLKVDVLAVASQGRRHAIGFANRALYLLGLARVPFHDVTAPRTPNGVTTPDLTTVELVTFGQDTSLNTTRGYDDVTGPGTPNGLAYVVGETFLA